MPDPDDLTEAREHVRDALVGYILRRMRRVSTLSDDRQADAADYLAERALVLLDAATVDRLA